MRRSLRSELDADVIASLCNEISTPFRGDILS